MCADQADLDRSNRLKDKIRQYFDFNQHHLPKDESLTYLDRMREVSNYEQYIRSCST